MRNWDGSDWGIFAFAALLSIGILFLIGSCVRDGIEEDAVMQTCQECGWIGSEYIEGQYMCVGVEDGFAVARPVVWVKVNACEESVQ